MKTGPARLDALYTLNETSAFIWQELRTPASAEDLATRLAATYQVDSATVHADVQGVLARLMEIGAIRRVEP
jgi:hypothetical protein